MDQLSYLFQLVNSYKLAALIFALQDVRFWEVLKDGPRTPAELGRATGFSEDRVRLVLELLSRAGVTVCVGNQFHLAANPSRALPLLRLEAMLHRRFINSPALQSWLRGRPGADPLDGDPPPHLVRIFLDSFAVWSDAAALAVWRAARLSDCRRLLDLGGADGALAVKLCRLSAQLRVTVADRSVMEPFWHERIASSPFGERIDFRAVNIRHPESWVALVADAECVVLSNILHLLTPAARIALGRSLRAACHAGSRIIIHNLFHHEQPADLADPLANCMSVDWLLFGGDFHMTLRDAVDWLEGSGFCVATAKWLPGKSTAVLVCSADSADVDARQETVTH